MAGKGITDPKERIDSIQVGSFEENASTLLNRALAGETVIITSGGKAVAKLGPAEPSPLQQLINTGRATPATRKISSLPVPEPGPDISAVLSEMRSEQRY